MTGRAVVCLAAVLALPCAAFTPKPPDGATETARASDPPARYGVAIGPAGPMSEPARQYLAGTRVRTAWYGADRRAAGMADDLARALLEAGFDGLFSCAARACGGFDFRVALPVLAMPDMFVALDRFAYRSFARDSPPALAAVLSSQTASGGYAQLSVILPDTADPPAAQPKGTPGASSQVAAPEPPTDVGAALDATGRAVLRGVAFAPGAAALSGQAPAVLTDLADWLRADGARRIALVGHTDWTGAAQANVALARARAEAVAAALAAAGIDRARLTVAGVGPYAPRRTNDTEAGRAANRRVEAVRLPRVR